MSKLLQLSKLFEIRSTETDLWDRLHMGSLCSMMQEIASDHAAALGTGTDVLEDRNLVYLLSGISLRLDAYPVWGETLDIQTWCREIVQLYFIRDFVIETTDGRKIATASSSWFLTDKDTHRPVRPAALEDLIAGYTFPDMNALGFNATRLKKGRLDFPDQTSFTKFADFSDMDRNRHVNNTRYIAWAIDFFYHHLGIEEPKGIRGLDINFLAEVKYGDKVQLFGTAIEGDHLPNMPEQAKAMAIEGRDEEQRALFRTILYY